MKPAVRRPALFGWAAVALVAATGVLYVLSRGKWSDPIIDSGREWIVPDALSRGDLLYRDVVFWFGPVTPYVHAAFFRLFGSSFRTLVLAGAFAGLAALFVLYRALRLVTDHRSGAAWTAVAVPLLLFMPSAGGVLLGMGLRMWHAAIFALLALTLAATRSGGPSTRALDLAAGAVAGLAGLCRSEWGIAAFAGVAAAFALRAPGPLPLASLARLAAAFLAVFGGGLGLFMLLAGVPALLHDAPVLLWNLPGETRASAASVHPWIWARGTVQMAYGAFAWLSLFLVIEILSGSGARESASARTSGIARGRLALLAVLLALAGVCAAIAGLPNDVVLCATPLLCAASMAAAIRMPRGTRAAVLGGSGVLGVLTAYRRPFFLTDGPYIAPPVLFAILCAAGCLAVAVDRREPAVRARLSGAIASTAAALAGALFLIR
ncbi:MAG TPA: glycosyltransferase family 39 protein, partial [Thermoanaerobaculia bacterium]